ncbi:hypothetical protein PF005_g31876 [Phytophthora fragariae]|uniref:Uncharacterized protein n=1 Tax=Phytophthora fragariae TaxID=53985 RepID=A0A6A4AUH3_9STRA|nr:hypothetical protein PF003_g32096 [Phytophthora fragariae]KAE8961667.1 hypothetical protein PF011_g29666 [Phytophthora fragariae]KAE9060070.1 hypothetical protein PF006_g31737 [Phytophthora fragariae]KAE9159884.1 hypothetical protein PF005_g31876 [Phytophthora fragariae]KAE9264158.1 hypothetical protein PF001_g31402 [Phytophthora fragariae]
MSAVSGVGTTVITPVNAQHLCRRPRAGVMIPGVATGNKKTRATSRRGAPCW